ncbi:MAG: LytTR family transcriptional regulator DNA-binding domain-containing protein [Flavobacteriaceae bacterium]|nr:LytTR family transcriptional regulator DNA-binding domain-containing protein [Flavobacteriaceae bacterium]
MIISKTEVTISNFFYEYFLFYVFQKSPTYILGYIAITVILFLSFSKEILQIEVQELIEIKNSNDKIYKKLKEVNTDKAKILNIKIGNKRKIIPVDDITWLEADNYCVNVHTINNPSYSMRSTLKSLEKKLGDNFLRVHRKGIVNMDKVREYYLATNPRVILINNQEVSVSKSNLKLVKSFLEK